MPGNVNVRYSVQDAEVVRASLERMGKDGEAALKRLNDAANSGTAANDNFAKSWADLSAKIAGTQGAVGGVVAQVISFAKGAGDLIKTAGPIGLVTGGIWLAVTAAKTLYDTFLDGEKKTAAALEEQKRLVDLVRDSYSGAADEAGRFSAVGAALSQFQQFQNEREIMVRLVAARAAALAQMGQVNEIGTRRTRTGPVETSTEFDIEPRFQAFAAAITALRNGGSFAQFNDEVSRVALSAPGLAKTAVELLNMASAASKLDPERIAAVRAELERTAQLNNQKTFSSSLQSLLEVDPEANAEVLRKRKLESLAKTRADALAILGNDDDILTSERRTAVEAAYETAVAKTNKAVAETADRYKTASQAIRDQIEELGLQEQTAGRTTEQLVRLKTEHDLLRVSQRAGREQTAELKKEIKELSDAYAEMTERVAKARLQGDIAFERDNLGRDAVDAAIASRQRGAGLPVDLNNADAAAMRFNENLRTTKDLSVDIATGMARDFRSGASAIDLMTNAAGKLQDKLISIVLDRSISALLSAIIPQSIPGAGNYNGIYPEVGAIGPGGLTGRAEFGRVISQGNFTPFAFGGVIRRPTLFPMANGGTGLAGEAGEEGVLPLTRINGRLGVYAAGGQGAGASAPPQFNFTIKDETGSRIDVSEPQSNGAGGFDFELSVLKVVKGGIVRGDLNHEAGAAWGVGNRTAVR